MSRPNIVRADTLDLQDQDNPTASEHQKHPASTGLAPHQAAELHHVAEERHSEEQSLHDAWHFSDNLTEEPGAIEQAQANNDLEPAANGSHDEGDDDGEGGESETETDDDMMDRISSSPSIDEGGYTLHSSPPSTVSPAAWPVRTTSLSPTPAFDRGNFNSSASPASFIDSSPFLRTPQHLPWHLSGPDKEGSPLSQAMIDDQSSSPFVDPPKRLSFVRALRAAPAPSPPSKHHHFTGRYKLEKETRSHQGRDDDDRDDDEMNHGKDLEDLEDDTIETVHQIPSALPVIAAAEATLLESSFRLYSSTRSLANLRIPYLEPSPSFSSIASLDLSEVLLPLDDPLLDIPPSPSRSFESSSSWESASDLDPSGQDGNDDDADVFFFNLDNRFIDSGWGGECLQDTEDIDFEFVYALHTFVATVEGQANATKGDTMVLLDDSNSYWWLVRVVKDSSIGYLPAEHIETPTERLARLNKHRNIDLSATMLSDNSEKSRNPLKKAMRRRNAKTVQFAAPTYVEASDYDYSSDEEQGAGEPFAGDIQENDQQRNGRQIEKDQSSEDAPLEVTEEAKERTAKRASFDREQAATAAANIDEPQLSPKLVDRTEAAPLKSRKGTPRNTDSFLKDDTIETRKITLTPGLLREDSSSIKSVSIEIARNPSMESLVKQASPPEPQTKKDIKEKKKDPKKGGMLSGLFKSKKKDKKSKEDPGEQSDMEKVSMDGSRASPFPSGSSSPVEKVTPLVSPIVENKRQTQPPVQAPSKGKLQKAAPDTQNPSSALEPGKQETTSFIAELEGSEAAHEMDAGTELHGIDQERNTKSEGAPGNKDNESPLSPVTGIFKSTSSMSGSSEPKPKKAKRSKQRVELDDFDSPADNGPNPFADQEQRERDSSEDRLSESPIEIMPGTFMHGTESIHIPTPGPDGRPGEGEVEDADDEPESLTSSPSLIDHPAEPSEEGERLAVVQKQEESLPNDNDTTPTGPRSPLQEANESTSMVSAIATDPTHSETRNLPLNSTASSRQPTPHHQPTSSGTIATSSPQSQQPWLDSNLRSWLDDGSEVKDMLVLIHDKSDVVPVGADHPLLVGLFAEERKGVQNMMGQLDGLLGSFIKKRGINLG